MDQTACQLNQADQTALNATRFRRLSETGGIPVFEGSDDGRILDGNDAFLEILGYSRSDLESGGIRWDQIMAPGYERVNDSLREQLFAFGIALPAEIEYVCKDGSALPAIVGLALREDDRGRRAIGFIVDQRGAKTALQELRDSEQKFRQLAENISEVFWMMDLSGRKVLYVSPAYEQIWGVSCQTLYRDPKGWMDAIHPDDRPHAEAVYAEQLGGKICSSEYRITQPSGAIRWIRDRAFPVHDEAGTLVRIAGIAEDVTEQKQTEHRLWHQAYYDSLTDLPNRRMFGETLRRAVATYTADTCGAVFYLDLDQFKLVNDTLGHSTGDVLLKQVAARLRTACAEEGTLARIGGDEFMILATGFTDEDAVRDLGLRLIECLDAPFDLSDQELFIGASIGISLFPRNGLDPETLDRDANIAMHEAKRAGKNQLRFFTAGLADAARERLELGTRLRRALALEEFRLQFQPQFTPEGSRPVRFEALIRWFPAGASPVSPVKFIPAAEESGLIVPIGTWVLAEACRQCNDWQSGPLAGVGVAVNVSAAQFACHDFVALVARTLEQTGLAAHLLELELTESVFVQDYRASARILTRLRRLGVTIALDDFGTGYSSLSYLQNLPIDALKIDRGFLREAKSRTQGAAVLRCVVDLAHTLGLRVIGEGAETTEEFCLLRELGCNEMQGFLLGRPSFDVAGAAWYPPPEECIAEGSGGLINLAEAMFSSVSRESAEAI